MKSLSRWFLGATAGATLFAVSAQPALATFEAAVRAFNSTDFTVAIDRWEKSALSGDARSMVVLGDLYSQNAYHVPDLLEDDALSEYRGENPRQDNIEALKWYLLAHVWEYRLDYDGVFLNPERYNPHVLAGERVEEVRAELTMSDVLAAEVRAEDVLEGGSDYDLYRLGLLYLKGRGFQKNNVKAMLFFRIAQDRNVPEASIALQSLSGLLTQDEERRAGEAYDNWLHPVMVNYDGETAQERRLRSLNDEIRARQLQTALEEAESLLNNVRLVQRALNILGFQAGDEDGAMGPSTRAAIRRFQAANNFEPSGSLRLIEIAKLFEDAADRNVKEYQYAVGVMYLQGVGVIANGQTAEDWLERSSDRHGYYLADYALGVLYRDGHSGVGPVPVQVDLARSHFAKAWGSAQYQKAKDALDELNRALRQN